MVTGAHKEKTVKFESVVDLADQVGDQLALQKEKVNTFLKKSNVTVTVICGVVVTLWWWVRLIVQLGFDSSGNHSTINNKQE